MATSTLRAKQRILGDYWYPMSKIMSIQWYLNRLQNVLFSIIAEHPDERDPYRKVTYNGKDMEIYERIWNALSTCEAQLIKIKKIHHPPVPFGRQAPAEGGCWCDEDCASGFHCNPKTWLCEPGETPPVPDQYIP
jgi:hypothetical protein